MIDRVPLAHLPTPIEAMERLADALGGPRLHVKRDDLTGLALGGNKARKLERLCADALEHGCDVLVTGGGRQSNHVRMTAAAANRLGLDCHLAIGGHPTDTPTGNLLLDRLMGATIEFTGRDGYYEVESAIEEIAARLAREGRAPYAIPIGGASVHGVLAYADAAQELTDQFPNADWVFVADGSGGTHAGLITGFGENGPRVVGVDVGTRPDLDDVIPRLVAEAASARGHSASHRAVVVDHDHYGTGYGDVTEATMEALTLTARTEGLVLDPVYTAKAMAAMFTWIRDGRVARNDNVVFWHTGGAPALFAHRYAQLF